MKQIKTISSGLPLYYLVIAVLFVVVSRALISLVAPLGYFGYDFGFYLFAIKNVSLATGGAVSGIFGGYNNPLFLLANFAGIRPEAFLLGSYFLGAALGAVALYYYLRKWNSRAAVFSVVLYACSIIQTEAYGMFLWKNIIALPFLLVGFKAFEEKRWWLFGISSAILALTHRTTFLVFAMTVVSLNFILLMQKKQWKQLAVSAVGLGVAVLASVKLWLPVLQNLLHHGNSFVESGLFLNGENKWFLVLPTILLAGYGMYRSRKAPLPRLVLTMLVITFFWYVLRLPFYNRMFIYFDVGLITFAAIGIAQIRFQSRMVTNTFLGLLVGVMGLMVFSRALSMEPYIDQAHVEEIQNFTSGSSAVPFVLITSADDAPWVLGYIHGSRLGAPGLFEDPHTKEEWEDFWRGNGSREFLAKHPGPLFLYERSYRIPGEIRSCLETVSENFSRYVCK